MNIEMIRKGAELRKRLDAVDAKLTHRFGKPARVQLLNPAGSNWSAYDLDPAAAAEVLAIVQRPLRAERHMILAEAAELGLSIEDEPPAAEPASEAVPA